MENIKVSVIVPIYNGADFLEKNLLNLSQQTLDKIEIILINDASTDNSLNILKAFKEVFPDKFVVINSEKNRGPGGARNIGLSYARGEYIGFVDADDIANPNMFKLLYEEAVSGSGDYDIVSCGFYSEECSEYRMPLEIKGQLDDDKRYKYLNKAYFIWNKIFKRTLIEKMKYGFREKVIAEDTDFTLEALARCEKVSYVSESLYTYVYNEKSATNKGVADTNKEYIKYGQLFEAIKDRCEDSGNYNVIKKIREEIVRVYLNSLIVLEILKDDFSYSDVKKFHDFAIKYDPDYYNFKYKDENTAEKVIYNALTNDIKKSYNNLLKIKKMINTD